MVNADELYDAQEWEDLPSENTPICSERLLHIEEGILDISIRVKNASEMMQLLKSYENLDDHPQINGVELAGNISLDALGITAYIDEKVGELESAILGGAS